MVRQIDGRINEGNTVLSWDGKNRSGLETASAPYFATVTIESGNRAIYDKIRINRIKGFFARTEGAATRMLDTKYNALRKAAMNDGLVLRVEIPGDGTSEPSVTYWGGIDPLQGRDVGLFYILPNDPELKRFMQFVALRGAIYRFEKVPSFYINEAQMGANTTAGLMHYLCDPITLYGEENTTIGMLTINFMLYDRNSDKLINVATAPAFGTDGTIIAGWDPQLGGENFYAIWFGNSPNQPYEINAAYINLGPNARMESILSELGGALINGDDYGKDQVAAFASMHDGIPRIKTPVVQDIILSIFIIEQVVLNRTQ